MKSYFLTAVTAFMFVACSAADTPERAGELASAALKVVRAEQRAMAAGVALDAMEAEAEKLFLAALEVSPEAVREYVKTGGGSGAAALDAFIDAARALPEIESADDPAAVMRGLLDGRVRKNPRLLDGYLVAFQMCMEIDRDGTVLQDLMPFIVVLGSPMTFQDLGLTNGVRDAETLGNSAAARIGRMPYATTAEDFVMPLVKLDSWGGKFSGQVTLDTLAARIMAEPWFETVRAGLEGLPYQRIGFLGDSHMDGIHWSTAAPFPEIIRGVFRKINPSVEVINAGKGGDDSGEGLERMDRALVAKGPQISFVMFGGNDCRHYGRPNPAVTPDRYMANIREIVSRLEAVGSEVVLMETTRSPGELTDADARVFDETMAGLRTLPPILGTGWIDIGSAVAAEPVEKVYSRDLIHMNPEGHKLAARLILKYLAEKSI